MDGYANLIAARLRKLAAAESTGMLPVSGRGDGSIYFRGGQVVYAESSRTPTPVRSERGLAALGLVPAAVGAHAGHAGYAGYAGSNGLNGLNGSAAGARVPGTEVATLPSLGRLTDVLALTEQTIDAITDLLSSESRYAKFRPSEAPPIARPSPLPVGAVLAEVERRRQILRQLGPVITADTPVVRDAARDSPSFQVSAPQWALLVRVGEGATPRTLAMTLDRSVFGTTIEAYRLLTLGLLAVPGRPPVTGGPAAWPAGDVMSFLRAVSDANSGDERGSDA